MAHLFCTNFCWDCIDRQIVQKLRIERELSDQNDRNKIHEEVNELLRTRERLAEEEEKMGRKI